MKTYDPNQVPTKADHLWIRTLFRANWLKAHMKAGSEVKHYCKEEAHHIAHMYARESPPLLSPTKLYHQFSSDKICHISSNTPINSGLDLLQKLCVTFLIQS